MRGLIAALFSLATALACPGAVAGAEEFAFKPAIRQAAPSHQPLKDITRAGERLVAVGERGVIVLSDDAGRNWRQAEVPVSTTLTAVSFSDASLGWAAGHGGVILHSDDGGEHWRLQFDGNRANAQFLAWARDEVSRLAAEVAAGDETGDLQYALEDAEFAVEDAQLAVDTGPADPFLDILMLDAQRGFAVGAYGMLYMTADGGENWNLDIDNIDNPQRYHYYAIAADAAGGLYLSGEAGLLFRSLDGGDHWQRYPDLYEGSLFGILALDGKVLAFGLRGHVFRSEDRGESWQAVDTGYENSLYGGSTDGGEFLLFGASGQVLRSRDGGHSFDSRSHDSRATFTGGLRSGDNRYLLVGMDGLAHLDWGAGADD